MPGGSSRRTEGANWPVARGWLTAVMSSQDGSCGGTEVRLGRARRLQGELALCVACGVRCEGDGELCGVARARAGVNPATVARCGLAVIYTMAVKRRREASRPTCMLASLAGIPSATAPRRDEKATQTIVSGGRPGSPFPPAAIHRSDGALPTDR